MTRPARLLLALGRPAMPMWFERNPRRLEVCWLGRGVIVTPNGLCRPSIG